MIAAGNADVRSNYQLPWLIALLVIAAAGGGGTAGYYIAKSDDEEEVDEAQAALARERQNSRTLGQRLAICQDTRPTTPQPSQTQYACQSSLYTDEVFERIRISFTNPPDHPLFRERIENVDFAMRDFANPLYALHVYATNPNLTPDERALMTGMNAGLTGVINLHALGYPYFGTTQEIAGWSIFDATVLLGARRDDFYSPWWLAYQSAQEMGCDPEKFMTALYPVDATVIMMLDYGRQGYNETEAKVRRGDWVAKEQGGRYYLCRDRTWNESRKIEFVEYFRTTFWQGTLYNQRMEEVDGAIRFARGDCSACMPSEEMVAQLEPRQMDEWDIPERVIYRLGQMRGFAEYAAKRLIAAIPNLPPPPPRDAGTRPDDAGTRPDDAGTRPVDAGPPPPQQGGFNWNVNSFRDRVQGQ